MLPICCDDARVSGVFVEGGVDVDRVGVLDILAGFVEDFGDSAPCGPRTAVRRSCSVPLVEVSGKKRPEPIIST
jgi:hypothetical protein